MERIEHHVCFGGSQEVWRHHSAVTGTPMTFSVFLPPQAKTEKCPVLYWLSGLTCNEQNFITKAGAQRYAAEPRPGDCRAGYQSARQSGGG